MPSKKKLTPAELVLARFSQVNMGPRALGRALEVDHSRVLRWPKPRAEQGSDGQVPRQQQAKLLALARKHDVELSAEELILGGYA